MYRFSFVQQEDSMQCGVACLQMICRYFGKNTLQKDFLASVLLQRKEYHYSVLLMLRINLVLAQNVNVLL